MLSQRRAAQLGLLATGVVLISCLGVLVGQSDDGTAGASTNAPVQALPVAAPQQSEGNAVPMTVTLSSSIQPAQGGSVR